MSDNRSPLIVANAVRQTYRRRTVLDVERFDVMAGETHALLGPSGAGKSTLLRIVGLLERPREGSVRIDGEPVTYRDRAARLQMAAVFQKPYLFAGTVSENVAYGLRLRRVPQGERADRVASALADVGLTEFANASALTLSGGEAQRVALARALVLRPRILLLDEPLSYLDPLIKRRLVGDFRRILAETDVTTLYVTHDQDEAMVVADRVSIMHEGRIVRTGDTHEVMSLPTTDWVADFVGMESPLRGRIVACHDDVSEVDCGGVSVFGLTSLPVGADVLVGVRPEDVTLFAGEGLPPSSARNALRCCVDGIEPRGATARVTVAADGLKLASLVSLASLTELGLAPGMPVVAMFKATAVRIGPAPE